MQQSVKVSNHPHPPSGRSRHEQVSRVGEWVVASSSLIEYTSSLHVKLTGATGWEGFDIEGYVHV